jgi:peptide/nickel transport system ATP-binding protein
LQTSGWKKVAKSKLHCTEAAYKRQLRECEYIDIKAGLIPYQITNKLSMNSGIKQNFDESRPVLSVRNLTVEFSTDEGVVRAVRGLSYEIHRGEILAIVGESGSGKSVSSLAIMGLLPGNAEVKADGIYLDDRDLLNLNAAEMRALRGRDIGIIFQDSMMALNPVMTVGEQITEPLIIHLKLSPKQARVRAEELLELVGIPDASMRLDQYPHQFSGGMRQRVMIAIGLSCNPKLLIADEPTTALDVTIQAQILELMHDLCRRLGVALLIITHNLGVVAHYADRVLVMYAGRTMERGKVRTVFENPRHMYTAGLLACVPSLSGPVVQRLAAIEGMPPNPRSTSQGCLFAPRCTQSRTECNGDTPMRISDVGTESACVRLDEITAGSVRWVSSFSNASEAPAKNPNVIKSNEILVRVESLEKTYSVRNGLFGDHKSVKALRDVSLSVSRRETVGIVGESGCGKSTLGKLMLRLEEPTSGRILFRGEDITHKSDRMLRSFRQHTQVVFQDPFSSLNPRQRIGDILVEPMLVHKIVGSRAEARDEAERILLEVGIGADYLERFAHEMSGGQRQRVAIARALAMRPEFIVCDEAVSALDVSIQAQVVNLLADLQSSLGLSYLFIGHDLAVVRQIATRVMVMYLGRVVEVADRDTFYSNPKHPYSQMLMAAVPIAGGEHYNDRKMIEIRGEPPSAMNPPSGCAFRTRCSVVMPECAHLVPELRTVGVGQQVACLRYS